MDNKERNNAAKAWCFENGVTAKEVETAWQNALTRENFIIKNLNAHGQTWEDLPKHLLAQLVERYGQAKAPTGAHFCKQCGKVAEGTFEDLLCAECRRDFGHALYSEL
jgi:hypothetical protein